MNPIIIPTHSSSPRQPTWSERKNIAATEYSNNRELQEAFMDGADWCRGPDESTDAGFVLFLLTFLFGGIQIVAFVFGILEGPKKTSDYHGYGNGYTYTKKYSAKGNWKYLAPGYAAGTYFIDFMNAEDDER